MLQYEAITDQAHFVNDSVLPQQEVYDLVSFLVNQRVKTGRMRLSELKKVKMYF